MQAYVLAYCPHISFLGWMKPYEQLITYYQGPKSEVSGKTTIKFKGVRISLQSKNVIVKGRIFHPKSRNS